MRLELFNYLTIIQSSRLGSRTIAPTDLTPRRMEAHSSLDKSSSPPLAPVESIYNQPYALSHFSQKANSGTFREA
ncbi:MULTISPECIES: hypothetical protein [unclassified Microcoleus]|uniref:hypothetical protein n=1 Tax=unclassified Microcoleus TaxID=2642155 RepID=UPI002FD60FEC